MLVTRRAWLPLLSALALLTLATTARVEAYPTDDSVQQRSANQTAFDGTLSTHGYSINNASYGLSLEDRPKECPPCFNCQLPAFNCANSGKCRSYDGQCDCPIGFGGQDCLAPLCGSPVRGKERFPREGDTCACDKGWGGLNCNVCQSSDACAEVLLGGERLGDNATCYTGGSTGRQSFQQCDVTNKQIRDLLPGRPPKVTFSCQKDAETCNFQFWIGQKESFYCDLSRCSEQLEMTAQSNNTLYTCEKAKCSCIPGRMLCGESGSIDIGEFLDEEIKGPAKMSCRTGKKGDRDCKFEEPGMNGLITDVFGDQAIFLSCQSGECVHYSQVPGYQAPLPPPRAIFWVAFSAVGALLLVFVIAAALWMLGRHAKHEEYGSVRLPEDEAAKLMAEHVPASLSFKNLSYRIGDKLVLDGINGTVKPGEVMAIAGSSGAGKTTLLDLLARREKRGVVAGTTAVNGRPVSDGAFKRITGFVDQEDCLMSTLTVYETVLYSALLRLPREMSIEAKRFRTLETLQELGILHIKDSRIGDSGHRSISGGEKRRVSIACELVTSPSVLFLDEPTSGLDSANALNVVECLTNLAQNYRRTVVLSLHQPSSKIVSLLDKLLLLSAGKLIYSGSISRCGPYFADIGYPCPEGHNLLEHLIDLTSVARSTRPSASETPVVDEESGLAAQSRASTHELRTRPNSVTSGPASGTLGSTSAGRLAAGIRGAFGGSGEREGAQQPLPPKLVALVEAYSSSSIAAGIRGEIDAQTEAPRRDQRAGRSNGSGGRPSDLADVEEADKVLRTHQKASLFTQLRILSGRSFKNLYRNPQLMLAHYALSLMLGVFVGVLFWGITNDIAGFQNRLGLCFFTLALFGFSTLTSLGIFASERQLYVRERANGYYSPITYFFAKLLFDNLPLRVVPPLLFGPTIYFTVGLVPQVAKFWIFILTLVLFSLATSSIVFFLSVSVKDTGVASLIGTLVMLISLLFAGLLINREKISWWLTPLLYASPFHSALESLLVSQLSGLTLKEHKYGIDIEVPASVLLSSFGFRVADFLLDNLLLAGTFLVFNSLSLLWLALFVRERK
ncbi:unnamed protein product [Parajaminaea phylloscopi]